jgi:Xaa-Pro aminopeptidase
VNQRLTKLRAKMAEVGLDGLLVSAPVEDTFKNVGANRRYLSGFTGSMGTLLVTAEAAFIVVDSRYYQQAQREAPDFSLFPASGAVGTWFASLMGTANLTAKKVGFQPGDLTVATYQAMTKAVRAMDAGDRPKVLAAPPLVEQMRAIKDAEEVAAVQRAVDVADEAFEGVARRVEPGWTEAQVAWEIEKHVREHGGGVSFETIVAAGPWAAQPHAYPRADKRIEAGEPIVIDMGARVDGYCSDLTRTFILGKANGQFDKIYDIVLTAQEAAEALIRAGMPGEEAHLTAHNVITEAGYGENFDHGLGHGVGLQVHEAPRLAKTSKEVLADGMVFTVEPGVYIKDWGGVRIEDMAVMENGRLRVLTHAPKVSVF